MTTIIHYLEITKYLQTTDQLIINYKKPHKAVTTSKISRGRSKVILGKAGIGIEKYSSHSQDQPLQVGENVRDYH